MTRGGAGWLVKDTWLVALVGLLLRSIVVAWAWDRIPPTADGTYYDILARRLAEGAGYTWLWPDGTVTAVAHYPVGYPALVALAYAAFGPHPGLAMVEAAVLGAVASAAVHRTVAIGGRRAPALLAGLTFAVHPALVLYTPALMTEGVAASLLAVATFAASRLVGDRPVRWAAALGVVLGAAIFVRPQCALFAPLLPVVVVLVTRGANRAALRRAGWAALLTTACALALVAPWTARNCASMGRCALVSTNGGWNLAIGADPDANGTWAELKVPAPCRAVFDEAEKDACFGREAARHIARDPVSWAALAPKKLMATFEYQGAGAWYLHAANPGAFPASAKVAFGATEVLVHRLLLAVGLLCLWRRACVLWPRLGATWPLRALGWLGPFALALSGLVATLALGALAAVVCVAAARRGGAPEGRLAPIAAAAALVLATAATHAVFFGAGRYGLLVIPALCVVLVGWEPRRVPAAPKAPAPARASSALHGPA